VLASRAVVGVEVTDDEAAAVEEQDNWGRAVGGIAWRPINADAQRARRSRDGPVLHPQLRVQRPARQVAEPLARRVDTILG